MALLHLGNVLIKMEATVGLAAIFTEVKEYMPMRIHYLKMIMSKYYYGDKDSTPL